ncbi:MAG: ABC transporter ATP-binding protein [Eubacteriales bacterium]|nr:ABC transporter ATP-binding protein [Eubacteriales bacterium]
MLTATNIQKRFGSKLALNHVNIQLNEGHVFGLLGTNGAGKSTLLRVLSGILRPEGGTASLDDKPIYDTPSSLQDICYLSDEPAFLYSATMSSMGSFQRAYYPAHDDQRLKELCQTFSLPMDERIHSFSKGTQKRAQLCLALARRPKVLLCDETFDGLDPVMREAFKRKLSEETYDRGLITVLAGHNQQEMEDICDQVGFLHEGELFAAGDLDSMLRDVFKVQCAFDEPLENRDFECLHPLHVQRQGRLCVLTMKEDPDQARAHLESLHPVFMEFLPLSLEEVFIVEMEEKGYAN